MKLLLHSFELPLRHTFTISRESIDTQPTMIVELQDDGVSGFGEATSNRYYGFTVESMSGRLEAIRHEIETAKWERPEELWRQMQPLLAEDPFALCALDQAAHDLWGKRAGKPVYELWGLTTEKIPASNYTIGIDTLPKMLEKLQEFPDWPIYKIKLGTKYDMEIVRELRKHTDAVFRVDANCGWTADQAIEYSHELAKLNVEFIEQPLPADQWSEVKRVYEKSALPIVADESCICEADVKRCVGHFHGVNVKLTKCGGLTPGRRMVTASAGCPQPQVSHMA